MNLIIFYGSCGHTTTEEISDPELERLAASLHGNEVTIEGYVRTVEVAPERFTICKDCCAEIAQTGFYDLEPLAGNLGPKP